MARQVGIRCLGLLLGASAAMAAHAARPAMRAPSFREAVEAAWSRLPQRQNFVALRNVAAARYAAGSALFPNAPYATGTYIDDRGLGSHYNYITTQGEVATPIWLPGEGTATQNAALADASTALAQSRSAHLVLAMDVLDLTTRAAYAVNTRDVAERRLKTAQALARDIANRYRVGESSQSDALAADAAAASAQATLSLAQAQLAAAVTRLGSVTGMNAIPRLWEPMAAHPVAAMLAAHPQIVAAERTLAAAQAKARLTWIENRDSPTIGLEGINEKQSGTRWDTRVGVVFRLPFATQARNAPLRAAAEQAVTRAAVQLDLTRRTVLAGIREAQAMLAGAERGSVAAARAAAALDRRRDEIERAWRLGEMPLIELIRANALAFDADLARDKARTTSAAARLRIRLAEGVLP